MPPLTYWTRTAENEWTHDDDERITVEIRTHENDAALKRYLTYRPVVCVDGVKVEQIGTKGVSWEAVRKQAVTWMRTHPNFPAEIRRTGGGEPA